MPPIPTWRLNTEACEDPAFRDSLGTIVHDYLAENEGTASSFLTEWEALKVVVRGYCIASSLWICWELNHKILQQERFLDSLDRLWPHDNHVPMG